MKKEAGYKYTVFGETSKYGDTDFYNEVCYTGGIYDENTELYYLNARYYDPEDGRFITMDTYRGDNLNPQSLHLYSYCENNAINFTDPTGHWKSSTHRYITSRALKYNHSKILKSLKYRKLLMNKSNLPDKLRKTKAEYKKYKYHGQRSEYKKVKKKFLRKAIKKGKEKYKTFYKENAINALGIALHTTQDYNAHNMKINGKLTRSRDYKFVGKEKHGNTFDNSLYTSKSKVKWNKVNSKADNPRIKASIKKSSRIIKKFLKKI